MMSRNFRLNFICTAVTLVVASLALGRVRAASNNLPANQASTPPVTAAPSGGVVTSTPNTDGSLVHIVQPGDTLFGIAEAYGVSLQDLLSLNNRQINDPLYVGDRIIVRLANTPTPTPDVTETNTPRPPTATRRPTRTATLPKPTQTPTPPTAPAPTATPLPPADALTDSVSRLLFGAIIVLAVSGVGLMIAGAVMKRRV